MATNPMQRKARNSFLLGVLVMLLISALIIGVLVKFLIDAKKEQQQQELAQRQVYVLNTEVKSGQIITADMLNMQTVLATTVPSNAITDLTTFVTYSLQEKKTGNSIQTDKNGLYMEENGAKVRITKEGEQYYKTVNNQKELVEFMDAPLVAKVNMPANSVLTLELVAKSDEIANDDLRLQEYNMLNLPVKVNVDDYIDVRLRLPSGQDYIVVSKKRIVDMMENTIWLKLSEEEILAMSNATVEAYQMTGSSLYVNLYVEPGLQTDATPTYAVSPAVLKAIENDPNIRQTAKKALFDNYTQAQVDQRTNDINGALSQYAEKAQENIEAKVKEENEKRQELREKYLEQLSGTTTVTTEGAGVTQ